MKSFGTPGPSSLAGWIVLLLGSVAIGAGTDFTARFTEPPPEARILKIIHGWPDQLEAQDRLRERLQQQGFGGVVCNVSFENYLESDAKWSAFTRAVGEAKKAGMALWLYDERGYPSGNAGGLVLRGHPEWEARGLLVSDAQTGPGTVELNVPPGELLLAAAFPVQNGTIDLARRVILESEVRDGRLRWSAPEGQWHVMVFTESRLYEGTHAQGNLSEKMPYINLLMPEPTKRFIDLTHQRYAEHLGNNLGQTFVATFTDEPSLMSCYLKPMPWRPLPWAPGFSAEFKKRRGYELDKPVLPALVGDAGPRGARVRYDFWLTVGELVSDNFFGQIQDRCRNWNIPSGGHLLMEEGLVAHVPLYGDFFRSARRLDAPSIDCLTSLPPDVPWYIARLLASAAELEGHRIVMSETSDHAQVYRPRGDERPKRIVTEAEIRGTCNRQIVSGVNAITSYYSFRELSDDALRRLNLWVGRCCTALGGGHQVADVAMLYPVESIWPRFRPARQWANDSPEASAIEHTWRTAADSLFTSQRDFTVVDGRTLAEARIADGSLAHRDLRWRVLVLAGCDTLPLAAWQNLERFVTAGGYLIALRSLPANSEKEFPSPDVQSLARRLFGSVSNEPCIRVQGAGRTVFLPGGSEGMLPWVLDGLLERDVAVQAGRSPVRATHRRLDGHDVYFLVNDSAKPWSGTVTLCGAGSGERWDPAQAGVAQTNMASRLDLNLGPYGAAVLRYPSARLPRKHSPQSGPLPNLSQRTVPEVKPGSAKGEFVRGEVVPDAPRTTPGHPAWSASATLTKSQVDTFMFVRFIFPGPLNLEDAQCLVLDAWIPEGQRASAQLLAIVQEQGGGDFLASTSCSLSAAGHQRVFVPLNRLQLAGWSKDADGELDLRKVSEIRIGWGGYYGTHGERIGFSLALPQIGSLSTHP